MEILEGRRLRAGRVATIGAAAAMSIMTLAFASSARAATAPVNLGTAGNFAVLGGQTVTNTGPSVITGDLGSESR